MGQRGGPGVGDGLADLAELDVGQGAPAQGAGVGRIEPQRLVEVVHRGRRAPR